MPPRDTAPLALGLPLRTTLHDWCMASREWARPRGAAKRKRAFAPGCFLPSRRPPVAAADALDALVSASKPNPKKKNYLFFPPPLSPLQKKPTPTSSAPRPPLRRPGAPAASPAGATRRTPASAAQGTTRRRRPGASTTRSRTRTPAASASSASCRACRRARASPTRSRCSCA